MGEAVGAAGEQPGLRALWRNRDYMLLWGGQAISRVGSRVSALALPLLMLALTDSPAQAGLLAAAGSVPALLLSLPAGAAVDRWNRRRVMMLCDAGRAAALLAVPVALALGLLAPALLYGVVIVEGALGVLFGVAQTAALPRVVPKAQLSVAAAQNEALFPIGDLLGPSLGGVLYGAGRAVPFLADAASYLANVAMLLLVRTPLQDERAAEARREPLGAEIAAGVRWLWGQRVLRLLAVLTGGAFFADAGGPLCALVLARQLGASPQLTGLTFAVAAPGGLLGFALVAALQRRFRFRALLAGSLWGQALVWPLLALAPHPLLIGAVLGLNYLVFSIFNSVEAGYRLSLIPDAMQGRVNGAFRLAMLASYPLGAAAAGLLIERVGVGATLLLFGVWLLLLALWAMTNRHLRADS